MYTLSRIDIMINLGQNTVTSIGIFILVVILRLMTASLTMKNRKFSFVLLWPRPRETDRPTSTSRNMILPLLAIVIKITWPVTKYIFMLVMGLCLILLFVFAVMMLTRIPGRVVSDGEVGRLGTNSFRRKEEIFMKVDDSYKHVDGGNEENTGYQPRKGSCYKQKDQTKKQKERRWEITTPVKIQNMSSYTHTKIYENGLCKFIEHHHGETKQFIESGADISYLTNHFFSNNFYLSLVTMAMPITDDYLEVLPVDQEADQPTGNQTHQNYERDDNAIDPYCRRRHRQSTRNNLSSLVESHTSSGFNSLTVYDHSESSLTSYPVIGRNDLSITSVNSGQQNIHSSGYQYGQRRSSVASRSFSFSHQLQADRPITEEEQNNGYTASPIPLSAVLRTVRHETRENRLSSGENTSTVSLHESTCTQRKEVQSSENTSRSAENPPDDNSHQQVALATPTTTASSCPRPRDQPRMLERLTCSAICNDDSSSNGSKEKCPVRSSRSLSHDMCNINRESLKEHYGSFDRIQHYGNIKWQDQAQKSSQGSLLTTTEKQIERQVSEVVETIFGNASSSLTNDDDLFGEGQSPIPNSDSFGDEGEDVINECPCSTGDTREEDLLQDE